MMNGHAEEAALPLDVAESMRQEADRLQAEARALIREVRISMGTGS